MDFLSKITVTCFAASYVVALICEISRLFFRLPVRWVVMFAFGIAGLFAHGTYIFLQTNMDSSTSSPLANWSTWCLLAAFLLVASYLWLTYRYPTVQIGLFVLPLGLALIGIAELMRETPAFKETSAKSIWNSIHGGSLLLATVVMALGFVMGLMYLFQSIRLKQKTKQPSRFKLPSLEWLQNSTEKALVLSTILMGFGVISGFVLNNLPQTATQGQAIGISNPIVWSSSTMFAWCLGVTLVSRFYRPARIGRKMVYLAFSCFVFLALELALVLTVGHGSQQNLNELERSELNATATPLSREVR
jgi:ABC-type uncharacterized transport system permease subunit